MEGVVYFFRSSIIAARAAIAAKTAAAMIPRVIIDWNPPREVSTFPRVVLISAVSPAIFTISLSMVAKSVSKVPMLELIVAVSP